MNILVKTIIKKALGRTFQKALTFYGNQHKLILMYHRLTYQEPSGIHDPYMFVSADTFETHIQQILKRFRIVSLDELIKNENMSNVCSITFDDGWLDNYEIAFPILKKYKIPATIFIPVDEMATSNCFWFEKLFYLADQMKAAQDKEKYIKYFSEKVQRWSASDLNTQSVLALAEILKEKQPDIMNKLIDDFFEHYGIEMPSKRLLLDWDEIREMGANGITFGSHGLNHDIISRVDARTKENIVFNSLKILKEQNINYTLFFSYPNGNWDPKTVKLLETAGYKGAVTTLLGNNKKISNPFLLKRVGLCERNSCDADLLWFNIGKAILT